VRLPDGDGLSLLGPLRERSPHLQAVMVTGNASVESAMAAVRGAVFAYVLKPVSPPDLLDTTRRALDQAALYRERERLRRELERSERMHRELVESVPAFVLAMNDAGRVTTWNSELERVTGYGRAEMLGTDGRPFVGPDGRPTDLPLKAGGKRKVRWRQADVKGQSERTTTYAVGIDVTDEDEILRRLLRSKEICSNARTTPAWPKPRIPRAVVGALLPSPSRPSGGRKLFRACRRKPALADSVARPRFRPAR